MPNVSATANIGLTVNSSLSKGSFGTPGFSLNFGGATQFGVGAGAAQFNVVYVADRTVTAATPDVLDLTGVTLTQPDGTAATFVDFVLLAVKNNSTTAGQNIQIGGGTADVTSLLGSAGIETLLPGATFMIFAPLATGYALNSSTAHNLNINVAAGTGVSYSVAILGH